MVPFSLKYTASCSMFSTMKRKKVKFFILIFLSRGNFFDILLVFISVLQIHYSICFFHILAFYFYLLQVNFYNYLLLALLTFFFIVFIIIFHSIQYHVSISLIISCVTHFLYIVKKNKNYKTLILSIKLELFVMLIASSLFIYQKRIL